MSVFFLLAPSLCHKAGTAGMEYTAISAQYAAYRLHGKEHAQANGSIQKISEAKRSKIHPKLGADTKKDVV